MQFCFYPNHEHGCPHVSHCPHLGGAALGTLVNLATVNQRERQALLRTVDAQREQISRLMAETRRLEGELKQAKLELKLERQGKFATHQQEQSDSSAAAMVPPPVAKQGKKRGAPVGHPGWFRPTPAEYDWLVEVPAPGCCPLCQGPVTVQRDLDPLDHM